MDNIVNFADYKAEQELKRKKEELIAKIISWIKNAKSTTKRG